MPFVLVEHLDEDVVDLVQNVHFFDGNFARYSNGETGRRVPFEEGFGMELKPVGFVRFIGDGGEGGVLRRWMAVPLCCCRCDRRGPSTRARYR